MANTKKKFPVQGPDLNKECLVVFNYDLENKIRGRIVRYDYEEPWLTIIALDDGRYVMSYECAYNVPREG